MSECPHCHQPINATAVICPHCRTALKAFGHPGIPLYRANKDEFLCERCIYHDDDTCTFPQRPYAKTCTMYHDRTQPLVKSTISYTPSSRRLLKAWIERNLAWLVLVSIALICLAIAIAGR